jgi:hypothetical protein
MENSVVSERVTVTEPISTDPAIFCYGGFELKANANNEPARRSDRRAQ